MKKEKKLYDTYFKMVWAYMPLSNNEISEIDIDHRVRPYLLCLEKENFYYAFPATSNVFNNKIRYENQMIIMDSIIDDKKSLINLGQIYELPKRNIRSDFYNINSEYSNEIIKKVQACFEYSNYPEEFKEYFQNKRFSYSVNDLVESNSQLYTIVGYKGRNILFALPTYTYPKINTVEKITDGLKYFVDISDVKCLKRGDIDFYKTKIYGFLIGKYEKDKEELEKLINYYYKNFEVIKENKDYTIIKNLEPGMIISFMFEEELHKMIILENNNNSLNVLFGKDNQLYRDFSYLTIPSNIKLNYDIVGNLEDSRLEKLIYNNSENKYKQKNNIKLIKKLNNITK